MNANRPRASVLSMFDPLNMPPETPRREVHSPDSSSDKENDVPSTQPGQLTAFFNRVYTNPKMVKAPRDKLIDLGDISGVATQQATTMTTALIPTDDDEKRVQEQPPKDLMHSNDARTEGRHCRKPLADIKLEKTLPMDVRIPPTITEEESADYPTSPEYRSTWSVGTTILAHSRTTAAPSGAPLADVINAINLGSLDIHDAPPPPPAVSLEATADIACPNITVMPPDSEPPTPVTAMPPNSYASPFLSLAAPPPVFSPPVRRQHVSTSPNDPRRASVDLQSSFRLQMQSSDLSFDLLNDRISFLSQGQDSFWTGPEEDDTMDLAKKMLVEKYASIKEEDEIEPVVQEKPTFSQSLRRASVSRQDEKPASSASDLSSHFHTRIDISLPPAPQATEGDIAKEAPSLAKSHISLVAPSVSALHTIKKSAKVHEHTSSSSSISTIGSNVSARSAGSDTMSSVCTGRSASRAGSESEYSETSTHLPQPKTGRVSIRGAQRPPAGVNTAPTSAFERPSRALALGASTRSNGSSVGRPAEATRRASLGQHTSIQRPSGTAAVVNNKPSVAAKASRLSSTIFRNSTIGTSKEPAKSSTSGVRLPSRIPAPGGVASGLPRPASKLPTLSRATVIKASARK